MQKEFPISITNEQGILNLYFQNRNEVYKELPEYLGDDIIYYYWMIKDKSILITKQLVEQYKYFKFMMYEIFYTILIR